MNYTLHEMETEIDRVREISIVAMSGRDLVGTIGIGFLHRRSACIRRLFVAKAVRGKGIGSALVNRCCEIARASNCESVGLSLDVTNGNTEEFYKKLGFKFGYQFSEEYLLIKTL